MVWLWNSQDYKRQSLNWINISLNWILVWFMTRPFLFDLSIITLVVSILFKQMARSVHFDFKYHEIGGLDYREIAENAIVLNWYQMIIKIPGIVWTIKLRWSKNINCASNNDQGIDCNFRLCYDKLYLRCRSQHLIHWNN